MSHVVMRSAAYNYRPFWPSPLGLFSYTAEDLDREVALEKSRKRRVVCCAAEEVGDSEDSDDESMDLSDDSDAAEDGAVVTRKRRRVRSSGCIYARADVLAASGNNVQSTEVERVEESLPTFPPVPEGGWDFRALDAQNAPQTQDPTSPTSSDEAHGAMRDTNLRLSPGPPGMPGDVDAFDSSDTRNAISHPAVERPTTSASRVPGQEENREHTEPDTELLSSSEQTTHTSRFEEDHIQENHSDHAAGFAQLVQGPLAEVAGDAIATPRIPSSTPPAPHIPPLPR